MLQDRIDAVRGLLDAAVMELGALDVTADDAYLSACLSHAIAATASLDPIAEAGRDEISATNAQAAHALIMASAVAADALGVVGDGSTTRETVRRLYVAVARAYGHLVPDDDADAI